MGLYELNLQVELHKYVKYCFSNLTWMGITTIIIYCYIFMLLSRSDVLTVLMLDFTILYLLSKYFNVTLHCYLIDVLLL